MEGARGIEPPPGFADRADGFEVRGAPSAFAPEKTHCSTFRPHFLRHDRRTQRPGHLGLLRHHDLFPRGLGQVPSHAGVERHTAVHMLLTWISLSAFSAARPNASRA